MSSSLGPNLLSSAEIGRFRGGSHRPIMAMIEITNRCNLNCPVCFSDARQEADDVGLADIIRRLDRLLELAGPIPLQISGGEPTLHPHLPEVIEEARARGFKNLELVTNGLVIGSRPEYLESLKQRGLTAVYLQFDGLRTQTYEVIRGRDLGEERVRAVEAIRRAQLCCTLAVAVVPGINDSEIGDIVEFGVDHIDTVRAINFQSATRFDGRYRLQYSGRAYSLPELVGLIEEQGGLGKGGFVSDMFGHPQCNAMSLVYVVNGRLKPLFASISEETRRNFLGREPRQILLDLFQGKDYFCRKYLINPRTWKFLLEAVDIFGSERRLQSILQSTHILLFAKSFMDRPALDPGRLDHCCYGIVDSGGVYSFCAYNNVHRFKQRRDTER